MPKGENSGGRNKIEVTQDFIDKIVSQHAKGNTLRMMISLYGRGNQIKKICEDLGLVFKKSRQFSGQYKTTWEEYKLTKE